MMIDMKTLEEFRIDLHKDTEYNSIYKRFKEIEINAFNYKNEIQQNRHVMLRYRDEGESHIDQFLKENANLEAQLMEYMKPPWGRSVVETVWQAHKNSERVGVEAIKALSRATTLGYELLGPAEFALQVGYEKGWEKYVDQQIIEKVQELDKEFGLLKEKLYGRVKL